MNPTEKQIQAAILRQLGCRPDVRLFRNNVGVGWQGIVTDRQRDSIRLHHPRPLHAGLFTGSADLIGWQSVIVTPEMVGMKLAVFASIEVKGPHGKSTVDQDRWWNAVENSGGIATIARSVEEARAALISPSQTVRLETIGRDEDARPVV